MAEPGSVQRCRGRHMTQVRQSGIGGLTATQAVLLAVILVVGLAVRLAGTGWDAFSGLQPDERHMAFVSSDLLDGLRVTPDGSATDLWFDTSASPLNPRNTGRLYVYGEAPVLGVTMALAALGHDDFHSSLSVGRILSSLVDTATILATFLLAFALTRTAQAGLFAALLYAAAPTPLQLANFYTVDPWLACAAAWAVVLLVKLTRSSGGAGLSIGAGAAVGLALACKITGLFLAFPVVVAIGFVWSNRGPKIALGMAGLVAITAFVVFRLLNPFAFSGPGPIGLAPAQSFIDHLRTLADMSQSPDFPPNWSWMSGYSPVTLLRDMVLFGVGPVIAVGFLASLFSGLWRQNIAGWSVVAAGLVPLGLMLAVAAQPALRYGLPAVPLMAAAAGAAIARMPRPPAVALAAIAIWWASGIVGLHVGTHPRIEASRWLWTLPAGTTLAHETEWDEFLPVPLWMPGETERRDPRKSSHFNLLDLDMTAPDTTAKARRLADILGEADYLAVSSGRQRDAMSGLPDRFPMTAAYYAALSGGDLCYQSVLRLDRGYPLMGIRLNDLWAQEPWRVYDHPVVEVFRRQPCFDSAKIFDFLAGKLSKQE